MTDSADLERRYRRLLAWYPRAFRADNEPEILAVLLACAQDGQRRPGVAASVDLIRGAIRMRLRPAMPRPRAVLTAVRLMYAGAVLELAALVTVVVTAGSIQLAVARKNPGLTPAVSRAVSQAVHTHLLVDRFAVPIVVGLWLFMAWANGRGYDWARPAFMAFFALITAAVIVELGEDTAVYAPADMIPSAVVWFDALAATVLIFGKGAGAYYEAARPAPVRQ